MARPNQTDEKEFRDALVADLATITLTGNVFDRRCSVNSRNDFFDKLGADVNDEIEIRFLEVELVNIEDSPDEGFEDCPVADLTYNFHAFHQFADERSDDSNSDEDFTNLLFQLRDFFLDKRTYIITNWKVETEPLTPDEFTQFGNDTFTDVIGHFKDLTLKVSFYDKD